MKWIDAQEEFKSFFPGKRSFVHPFEDAREAMGVSQSRKVFTKGQPADYLVTADGITFYAEVKSSQDPILFALSRIRKPQWAACIRVTAAKGLYYFFIRQELALPVWYKIPAAFFISLQDSGVKSVRWEQLKDYQWNTMIVQ